MQATALGSSIQAFMGSQVAEMHLEARTVGSGSGAEVAVAEYVVVQPAAPGSGDKGHGM